jgi:transcriptional regulator with PAS, ATPase and Fis domain
MKTLRALTPPQRSFLCKVYEAAFANPFSEDRVQLDMSIAGLDKDIPPGDRLAAVISKVDAFLYELDQPQPARLQDFKTEDQHLVKHAILFSLFHRVMPQFDDLIARQIQTREGTCSVSFARETLAEMHKRGLDREEATRCFALFYQLRRAYHFIHQSLIGRCNSMKHLRMVLWNNVFTHDVRLYVATLWDRMEDFATLILGETGTGKGAAAAAIGRSGFIPFNEQQNAFCESFMASFVELNLSQFPESLIESELFGHRKGAFTGAIEAHPGTFSLCSSHGSVFLDEIGDVSIPVQIKLLRVLQDRTFSPVGSHERKRFHGRVIAATNKPLDDLRRKGLFRDDFYYRLCSDQIRVPALQQRIQEDPRELDDLLAIVTPRITGGADQAILATLKAVILDSVGINYAWPGNVRELEQCVRQILLSGAYNGQKATPGSMLDELHDGIRAGRYGAQALLSDYCQHLYSIHGTYEAVAKITNLDRRTVKKHLTLYA